MGKQTSERAVEGARKQEKAQKRKWKDERGNRGKGGGRKKK